MIADLDNFKSLTGHGRHLRHLPGGRLFRQGDRRAVVEVEPVRRLHDRRLHDLDLWSGRLDRRSQRSTSRIRPRPIRNTTGTTCCRACAPRPPGTACPAASSARPTPSNGASRGASSSTRSPTTARCTTRPASSPPKNLPELVETAAKLTKDLGGPYGIGVRGSRSWATIHPGFLSGYSNYGQKDFTVTDGKLKAAMNTAGVQGLPQACGSR